MAESRSEETASDVVSSIRFSFYSPEEVRRISVKAITKPDLLDSKGIPVPDGLYDPALGPLEDNNTCKSCVQLSIRCPGHCGHIDLAKPLYNPLLFPTLKRLLKATCFHCHKFKMDEAKVQTYVSQLDLIIRGNIVKASNLRDLPLSELDSLKEHSAENDTSASRYSSLDNMKEHPFTSLQYTELKVSLANFLKKSMIKKCDNCGKRSPGISSPTFCWLNKTTIGSDIRANLIKDSNLGVATMEGDRSDAQILSDIETDEVLQSREIPVQSDEVMPTPIKPSEEPLMRLKDLPAGFTEQMHSSGQKHLLPSEVEHIFEDLWKNNLQLCKIICDMQSKRLNVSEQSRGYAMFFLKALLVPPSKFRPSTGSITRGVLEHPQNVLLSKVLEYNTSLRQSVATGPNHPDIVGKWMDLQRSVSIFFDSSKGLGKSEKEALGVRQLLERKAGILRQKMMGKRVNFACRSVISPDPYLEVNEIGIPPYFALRLTYPERVTPWNVDTLRQAVNNGAYVHPGATHFKNIEGMHKLQSDTKRIEISRMLLSSRGVLTQLRKGPESEFEGKVVYRHIKDGDIVLVNRQPTLHKPSMMAHVVRILEKEKTLRMHYANCSTYNADFDGDEMNVHFPQDEISRSEAFNIVNANKQYIVPTNGKPIRGLIQDHIISAVLLTKKDTFLTRDEYHELLCACVPSRARRSQLGKICQNDSTFYSDDEIQPLLPAIWKPTPLWTGKQVLSAILCYITRGRAPFTIEKVGKIQEDYFTKNCSERIMYIFNNELIHGMIDKAQFGESGLVHTVHELYGPDTAGTLLSIFSRLFTLFLQIHGFTCGVDDLLLVRNSDLERKRLLEKSEAISKEVHLSFTATESSSDKEPMDLHTKIKKIVESSGDSATTASDRADPLGLHRKIEKVIQSYGDCARTALDRMMSNSLKDVIDPVNKLFPNGLLKSFPSNCLSLMTASGAKGGQANLSQISSLLGQQELEGKRVPTMVSGKTLPSFPPWDFSTRAGGFISDRFLTGLRPQEYYFHCMAGRDGLVDTAIKTSRSGYLQRCIIKNLECLKVSYDYTVRDADGSVIQFTYGEDGVDVLKSSFLDDLKVLSDNHKVVLEKFSSRLEDVNLSKSNGFIQKLPHMLREKLKNFKRGKKKKASAFLSKKQQGFSQQIKHKDLKKIVELKYLSSLAEPGESVGVIAAQSIGEPSTQMTLNTFHLAGRGEGNVTLGIPRLQEILITAKADISTPIMKCPLLEGKSEEDAANLAANFKRISVADVLRAVDVRITRSCTRKGQPCTIHKMTMRLYPLDLYPVHSNITLESLKGILEGNFVNAMEDAIRKHLETLSKINDIRDVPCNEDSGLAEVADEDAPKDNDGDAGVQDGDDENIDSIEDQGADAEKRKRQGNDEMEYEDDDEESSDTADEADGDSPAGFESEVDQIETDEDFKMVGGFPDTEAETEAPEIPSKPVPTSGSVTGNMVLKSGAERKTKKITRSRKKIDRVIYKKAEGSKFEAHFIFKGEPLILLSEIANKTAQRVYLKAHNKIDQCSVLKLKKEDKAGAEERLELRTAGVNFTAFWDLEEHLDIKRLESNDIHAMLQTYGVEAARATIINQVNNVFGPYGIHVDSRHLSLIADFMTCEGGYRPMNRLGMGNSSTSPFTKMTFETATKFISEAAAQGEVDELESPSANVSLGQPVKLGTGYFGLMQNLVS